MKTCFVCKEKVPLHRQRFCSEACSYYHRIQTAKRRRSRLKLESINCSTCKVSFDPKTTRQKYCSKHCWTIEQIKRRNVKRKINPKQPKEGRSRRFEATWRSPAFGEKKVTIAEHTKADSKERMEIQSAVEEYLKNGGEITKYGDQLAKIDVEGDIRWHLDESEEREIQDELAQIWRLENVLGN